MSFIFKGSSGSNNVWTLGPMLFQKYICVLDRIRSNIPSYLCMHVCISSTVYFPRSISFTRSRWQFCPSHAAARRLDGVFIFLMVDESAGKVLIVLVAVIRFPQIIVVGVLAPIVRKRARRLLGMELKRHRFTAMRSLHLLFGGVDFSGS